MNNKINRLIKWLKGKRGYKPLYLFISLILFFLVANISTPASLVKLLEAKNPVGYSAITKGETIVNHLAGRFNDPDLKMEDVAKKIKYMIAILLLAVVMWATVAIPIGATGFLIAALMYIFRIMPPTLIAESYMNDAVFFIIGTLVLAVGVERTKLDRRIGFIFLGWIKSKIGYLFIFGALIAFISAFLSARCLIAFLMPVLMRLYKSTVRDHGLKRDKNLGVFIILTIVYMTAMGASGAPSSGARNALMVGFFEIAEKPITYLQWMKYGMPMVPVGIIITGLYLYILFNKKIKYKVNPSKEVKQDMKKLGKYKGNEIVMTIILFILFWLWIFESATLKLGGAIMIGVVLMFITGIIKWEDLDKNVAWGIIWMYAGACSLGFALLFTGTGLWLAKSAFALFPSVMLENEGLLVTVSIITGIITNFMSAGAAVSVMAPITLPMAAMSNLDIWQIGLAIAFASTFGHCLIIGRPGLAIAYALGKDPETGERLITVGDLFKYGIPLLIITWIFMAVWVFYGYWKWMSF